MKLDNMTLELTRDELDIIQTALIYLEAQRRREAKMFQRRSEDPAPVQGAEECTAYLLKETQKDLKLLEQTRIRIRNAQVIN